MSVRFAACQSRTPMQFTSTISEHVASHLQFLAFLTPRLLAGTLVEGEERDFDSSAAAIGTDAYGERSTLEDHISETEDTLESPPQPFTTNSEGIDSLWPPPPVTDQADAIDWVDFNIIPRNLDINKNLAIEHMRKEKANSKNEL